MTHPIPFNEAERLFFLHELQLIGWDSDPVLEDICGRLAADLQVPMAWISFIDRDRAIFHAKIGLQTADVPREGSFCAYSILNGWVVEIPDAREDPIHASNPLVVGKDGVRFYAAAPLAFENKTRIGTIAVADVVPRNLDDFEMVALMRAAEDIEDELRTRYAHMVFEGAAPLSSVADR